jgi:hypothetical protein
MKPELRGTAVPVHSRSSRRRRERLNLPIAVPAEIRRTDEEYHTGPGRPPKEYQFKPGQSGNPKGAMRKASLADLKAMLERALNEKVKRRRGEKEEIITKAAAGIEKIVNGFVEGDRHARRDVFLLAEKLGVDLTAGQRQVIEQTLAPPVTADDQALVDDYVRHRWAELNTAQNDANLGHSASDDSKAPTMIKRRRNEQATHAKHHGRYLSTRLRKLYSHGF